MPPFRSSASSASTLRTYLRQKHPQARRYASASVSSSSPATPASPFAPRHLLSIADLTPSEFATLVRSAYAHKQSVKTGEGLPPSLRGALAGQTVAMTFSKRSTRTRVSSEGAVAALGGNPMFLGRDDIQLGVNESLHDTSVVLSSMVAAIFARVGPHSDVVDLARHASAPVLNALSDLYHPLQTIADFLTLHETLAPSATPSAASAPSGTARAASTGANLGLGGRKLAWVGDANNVLFDLAIGAAKTGVDLVIATPPGYEIPQPIREQIAAAAAEAPAPGKLSEMQDPAEAVSAADVIFTDTWVSMGQEEEKVKRLRAFEGFQVTEEMGRKGGAKDGWKFMHCLPRHPEEVSDEVFYGNRTLVWKEAENRLWAAIAALEAFVVNKGKIE
ncbi:Aspartate/ornithine carbamoyltransferase [Lineolata rhizophorae]|uniref:Ornithine carbamoyltransferase, mitochondrial n=1 Tax=Lineolata rhizophorae TaxID=578093 RepID=A0A6A6PC75_9PEZI|nr:Aspartate/ornithine carbamoyltransferase [Lineolata rhizophorae]